MPLPIKKEKKNIKKNNKKNNNAPEKMKLITTGWDMDPNPHKSVGSTCQWIHNNQFYIDNCRDNYCSTSVASAMNLESKAEERRNSRISKYNVAIFGVKCFKNSFINKMRRKMDAPVRDQIRVQKMTTYLRGGNCYCFSQGK